MHRTITFVLTGFTIILVLAGCNIPASAPIPTAANDMVLTQAAMTIVAEFTQIAPPATETSEMISSSETPQVEEPTVILISDTPEVSNTPEPTQTATTDASTTEAPTATPSPTITHTPTVTPLGEIIYDDDFSSDRWYTAEEDDWSFYYEDDQYHITNELLGAGIWSVRGFTLSDVRIEVDGRKEEGPSDGYYGVICRWSEEGENYYALVAGSDGFYGIARMYNGEFDWLRQGTDQSGAINTGSDAVNRIAGECVGEDLTLFVNDQKITEISDDSLTTGDIGLVSGNKYQGVGMNSAFDNFVLIQPQ